MPEETNNEGVPPGTEPAVAAPPPAPAAASSAAPLAPSEKVMVIPHAAMKREKDEAFAKGRQAGLDQLAKDAGYENHADLVSALAKLRQPAQAPRAVAPAAQAQDDAPDDVATAQANQVATRSQNRQEMATQRNLEKALNERNRYAQSASDYKKQLDNAREEVDAVRAEMHLRTIAAGVGVQDVDYAIMLLTRDVERLTPEEAASFDERAFFEGLRKTKPLLFGEMVQPANTGVGTGGAPRPPAPNQVASQQVQNGKVDARKLDAKAYKELLQARGISSLV